MKYFTSDLHFSHEKIIEYCNRPFINIEEMDARLIENWNSMVTTRDLVYVLGDFGFGKNLVKILEQLNGQKILITGSHDKDTIKYCSKYFLNITPLLEIKICGTPTVLCHYAMRTWSKSHYNSWHLFGHSHNCLSGVGKSMDVGVDCNNYYPFSEYEIKEIMNSKPDNFNYINK